MWGFVNCTRYYVGQPDTKVVLIDATLVVGSQDRVALLVPPGQGKSTIMRMLAGLEPPDSGTVLRDEGGWPLGYAGGFHPQMTGEENIRSMASFAGTDPDQLVAFAYDFSELGDSFFKPIRHYSATMRSRLSFALSFGVPAKTYLSDDKLIAGDEAFRQKCMEALQDRLMQCGLIFVGSNPRAVQDVCDEFHVLSGGKIEHCDSYEDARDRFAAIMKTAASEEADNDVLTFDLV